MSQQAPAPAPMAASAISLIMPNFATPPSAYDLALYIVRALTTIARYKLGIRIYVSRSISEKLMPLLAKLGVKARTVKLEEMTTPYIYIYSEGDDLRIRLVDAQGKTRFDHGAPIEKVIEAMQYIVMRMEKIGGSTKPKTQEKEELVDEYYIDDEIVRQILAVFEDTEPEEK